MSWRFIPIPPPFRWHSTTVSGLPLHTPGILIWHSRPLADLRSLLVVFFLDNRQHHTNGKGNHPAKERASPTPEPLIDFLSYSSAHESHDKPTAAGLTAPALSSFYLGAPGDGAPGASAGLGAPCGQGLLLGYAAIAEPEIEQGIETLARALA